MIKVNSKQLLHTLRTLYHKVHCLADVFLFLGERDRDLDGGLAYLLDPVPQLRRLLVNGINQFQTFEQAKKVVAAFNTVLEPSVQLVDRSFVQCCCFQLLFKLAEVSRKLF